MIKITDTNVYGWEAAIRGMRNPMNSWDKSDSYKSYIEDPETQQTADFEFFVGDADHDLMMRLAKGGSVHAKYRRMITVTVDITAPLYWWKEFDTYKVGTVANSCSTMHKVHAKEFTLDDFSHEHLDAWGIVTLNNTIRTMNLNRDWFVNYDSKSDCKAPQKDYWWQMIQLLPSSYNQKRTVLMNYEVLVGMYRDRQNHKLNEWVDFCDWIRELPYSELITGDVG
jgi:hypothetical protein